MADAQFVNFATRLDPETNARRRRIERLWDQKSPKMLEKVFLIVENTILSRMSDEQRKRYYSGTLTREEYHLNSSAHAEPKVPA
jgi:hypothetical protein